MELTQQILLLIIISHLRLHSIQCMATVTFNMVLGYTCINASFTIVLSEERSKVGCATRCSLKQRCQAFSTADGPCQLYVFDACSKSVRDCNCSRRGQVFVKQQPGLEPGALCPSGYGDDLCGVKYKLTSGLDYWWPSRHKCESESGLVIMADVIDASEMSHMRMLNTKYLSGSFWLGGYQQDGSSEPDGGWFWIGCNITMSANSSWWASGEPNNWNGPPYNSTNENALDMSLSGLNDNRDSCRILHAVCECLSPFE